MTNFKDLRAWQRAIDLAVLIFETSAKFPPEERYSFTNQLRRTCVLIPGYIAEGQARQGEFGRYLSYARGGLQEIETLLILALRLKVISESDYNEVNSKVAEVGKIINGLIRSLSQRS
jgi:four helix bundle protein